jgi:hypothetical protein
MPETKETWMEDICRAWQIPGAGDNDEIVERESFRLRVLRPAYIEPDLPHKNTSAGISRMEDLPLHLSELPLLAQPVVLTEPRKSVAITRWNRMQAEEAGDLPSVRPAVRRCPEPPPGEPCPPRAPAYLIGKMVHRALADWTCLALPSHSLNQRLEAFARREGLFERQALDDALARARRMLAHLIRSPLYQEINRASKRLHEVPLTLQTPGGFLQGLLDLLYLDRQGIWHALDWKTEWVTPEELAPKAGQYAFQMAAYAEAVRRLLGSLPVASVCFLPGGAKVYTFSEKELLLS